MLSHVANINLDNEDNILLGNHIDLNLFWFEVSKQIKLIYSDYIIRNQLDDAIESIL